MDTYPERSRESETEQLASRVAERLIKRQPLLEDHDGEHFNVEVFAGADGAAFEYYGQQFISLINHGRKIEIKRTDDDIWLDKQTAYLMSLLLSALSGSKSLGLTDDLMIYDRGKAYEFEPNKTYTFFINPTN